MIKCGICNQTLLDDYGNFYPCKHIDNPDGCQFVNNMFNSIFLPKDDEKEETYDDYFENLLTDKYNITL